MLAKKHMTKENHLRMMVNELYTITTEFTKFHILNCSVPEIDGDKVLVLIDVEYHLFFHILQYSF